jgi:hypothetical protein
MIFRDSSTSMLAAQRASAEVSPPAEVVEAMAGLRAAEAAVVLAKLALREAAASCEASEEQIVEMYWSVPEVPAEALAERLGTTAGKAARLGIWGSVVIGRCGTCLEEVREASRAAATKDPPKVCRRCRARNGTSLSWKERAAAHMAVVTAFKTMPYPDYLRTEHWQLVRQAALRRARWRCQVCNAPGRLDVHHRTYERRGQEWAADVVALCRGCHARHHGVPA